jgi:hypothetical protein
MLEIPNSGTSEQSPAVDFKPTDVNLCDSFPPLVGTMGRTEAELAAALLVRACQVLGDAWQDVEVRALGAVIRDDLAAKREPFHSMNRNPFCRPDAYDLVQRGCAEWVGEPGQVLRFTPKGFDGLRKVVERSSQPSTDPRRAGAR